MKRRHSDAGRSYIWVAVVIVAVGVVIYYFAPKLSGPSSGQSGSSFKPIMVQGTIPASSYGAGAVGTKTATSVTLQTPVSSATLGTIVGMAKISSGAGVNFTTTVIGLTDPKTKKLLGSTPFGADGSYQFFVEPGEYILSMVSGPLKSGSLPQRVYVGVGEVLNINFFVHR